MSAEKRHGSDSNGIALTFSRRFSPISTRVEKTGVLATARPVPGTIRIRGAAAIMTIALAHAAFSSAGDRIVSMRDGVPQSPARKMAQDR